MSIVIDSLKVESQERALRERNRPPELTSSETVKIIGSRYGFPMSFERVFGKRNITPEP